MWLSIVRSMFCLRDCVLLMMMNVLCSECLWMWVSGSILRMLCLMIFFIMLLEIIELRVLNMVCFYGFIFLF